MTDKEVERILRSFAEAIKSGLGVVKYLNHESTAIALPEEVREGLLRSLHQGASFTTAFAGLGLLTTAEIALLKAGETSGHLDKTLVSLADAIQQRRKNRHKVMAGLAYPCILIALAGCILPLPTIVTHGVGAYFARAFWLPLLMIQLAAFAVFVVPRLKPQSPLRTVPRALLYKLPFVGSMLRRGAYATFAEILGRCIAAGLPIMDSLHAAIVSSGDPHLMSREEEITGVIDRGGSLTEAIQAAGVFQKQFISRVAQAEATGNLPAAFAELAIEERTVQSRAITALISMAIAIVFLCVVVVIIMGILQGVQGYFDTIDSQINTQIR